MWSKGQTGELDLTTRRNVMSCVSEKKTRKRKRKNDGQVLTYLFDCFLEQVPDWISYSRESTEAYRSASRMAALSHDKMVATLTMYLPDHDVKG